MMVAQTLETVPEETVAPAATPESLTSDVPKKKRSQPKTLAVLLLVKD